MDQQAISETVSNLHWVDLAGLFIATLFLALGFWRGLWWQVVRLLGLLAAVAVARWVGPVWGEGMAQWPGLSPTLASGLGWFCAFLLTLIGAAFLGLIGSSTIEAMKLSLVNRVLGGAAGLTTGVLLHSALAMVGSLFAPREWREATFGSTHSGRLVEALTDRWPVLSAAPYELMHGLSPVDGE